MGKLSRRDFIKSSLATAAGVGIATSVPATVWSQVVGANDDIRVAVVGFRGQGAGHIKRFHNLQGVRVVALCDADKAILDREVKKFKDRNEKVDAYTDVRKLLDDKSIDAIVTATPNHWHSLVTVWACQAGKDVYVEKPVSHNVWEGRKMVEAARKYKRIVQTGTQKRSDKGVQEAFEYIQKGELGKIVVARGFCYKRRKSIGKVNGPQPVPESVDYDLWTGPAPLGPLMRKNLHYDWHWVWATGNGDIGNQGIHEMDMCRWALGQKGLAPRVMSIGGRFGYDDDAETANTQIAILDYEPVPLIFEVRGLAERKDSSVMDSYRGIRIGIVIECEGGYFAGGGGGGWVYDNDGKKIKQFTGDGGGGHQANFIKAVRSRKVSDLSADIVEGHISSALCHMGNISHRLGQLSLPEEIQEAIKDEPQAVEVFERFREHLFANWVDISKTRAVLGPWLQMDTRKERFVGDDRFGITRWANGLLKRDYRKGFVVPEKV
ncbi:MAG: Gfo/Idh/MocA family oxidoreductase [Planctomycetota bacterium]|jgi:predicted dehydrogenase